MKKRILRTVWMFCLVLTAIQLPLHAENTTAWEDQSLSDSLYSEAAVIEDLDTGQILSEKNENLACAPASLTKMLTCITAMESLPDLSQKITITSEMLNGLQEADASVAGLNAGDEPTVEDLLYCTALPSGADAANALAFAVSGSLDSFIEKMNQKAADVGMSHSHFTTVTGLDADDQYTTASDLEKLLDYATDNETFVRVFSAKSYTTSPLQSAPQGLTVHSTTWSTADRLGMNLPGWSGGKTGYTELAGRCLAYWADINDMRIGVITLRADDSSVDSPHIQDAEYVLNSLQSWHRKDLMKKGDKLEKVSVKNTFSTSDIELTAPENVSMDLPDSMNPKISYGIPDTIRSSYQDTQIDVPYTITSGKDTLFSSSITLGVPEDPNPLARLFKRISAHF